MEHDVKPAFGAADEKLDLFLSRGIINWGEPVQSIDYILLYDNNNDDQMFLMMESC